MPPSRGEQRESKQGGGRGAGASLQFKKKIKGGRVLLGGEGSRPHLTRGKAAGGRGGGRDDARLGMKTPSL